MRLSIKVIANAKENKILEESEGKFKVYLREKAINGRANKALIELLSDFFGTKKSRIRIVRGLKSREKIVELFDYER